MSPVELPDGVRRGRIEPLWERVDRNRLKLAVFVVAYVASIVASASLLAAVATLLFGLVLVRSPDSAAAYYANIGTILRIVAGVALVAGSGWVAYALTRSEKRLLRRLGAQLTPTGEYTRTKLALKDMALAAGFQHAPALWVIPDCTRVNAFAIGHARRSAVMGVTQGFVDKLDATDQRAVFANLIARLTNGDVRWATAVSALVGPIWWLREQDLRRDSDDAIAGSDPGDLEAAAERWDRTHDAAIGAAFYFVLYAFVIVITELLLAGHQRSTMLTAEKADAEGMLLLKDPREMLHALETVLEADNTVPSAGEAHSALFYCWAGFGYAPEDDPEFARLARLREVLGAEGLTVRSAFAMPPNAAELVAVPAPRIEQEETP